MLEFLNLTDVMLRVVLHNVWPNLNRSNRKMNDCYILSILTKCDGEYYI